MKRPAAGFQRRYLRVMVLSLATSASLAFAAPAGDALDRVAAVVRAPGQAVLLGAAQAGSRIVAVGERGIVALSDDGGLHWRQAEVPTSVTLTAVRFADDQHGWAVGHAAVVISTEDSGEHWTRRLDGRLAAQVVLESARAGGDAQSLKEAERLVADGADKPLLDLLLVGDQQLLAVGAYGLALSSDDGGKSWLSWSARLPNPKGLHIYSARHRGHSMLLAGEQGLAMLSTDDGRSFRRLETPYKGTFFTAELFGESDLLLAGLRGNVLRSHDGGGSWIPIASPMAASITATALDRDGSLLAVNQAGFVMALQEDRLVPINSAPLPPLTGLLPRSGTTPLVLTVRGAQPVPPPSGSSK